jgi:hypothetical protein
MQQIATERVQPGGVRGVDIAALYSQHQGDGYELYARHSNIACIRLRGRSSCGGGMVAGWRGSAIRNVTGGTQEMTEPLRPLGRPAGQSS